MSDKISEWSPDKMRDTRTWVPMHIRDGLTRYIEQGIRPGSGLRSILENRKLSEVIPHVDETVEQHLGSIYRFLYNHAPGGSHGSTALVEAWIENKGLQR